MIRFLLPIGLLAIGMAAGAIAQTTTPAEESVKTASLEWRDTARNRDVPVKIYYPAGGSGPFPVIIFSHGLGGSRDGYEYLGRYWAERGYVSVHVQHVGSDDAVWRSVPLGKIQQAMQKAAVDPANLLNRPKDISFAIDELEKLTAQPGPWKGRLDMARLGVAGHSFGAYTAMAIAGQSFPLPQGLDVTLADKRVKAAIAMSTPVQDRPADALAKSFGSVAIPCLHMTGTRDDSPITTTKADQRRTPFDMARLAPAYLVIFKDADHMTFATTGRREQWRPLDKVLAPLICQTTTTFWDAYLKDDPKAKAELDHGGMAGVLGDRATWEQKSGK